MTRMLKRVGWMGLLLGGGLSMWAQPEMPPLENPMSVPYVRAHLTRTQPRLGYTPERIAEMQERLKTDPVFRHQLDAIRANAEKIYSTRLPDGKIRGKRLLGTSRQTLYRINMLGALYALEKDPRALKRIDEEIRNVSSFPSWNPYHFLDVAEMALAVSLALDWTAGDLPKETIQLAKTALIERAIQPSWPKSGKRFARAYGDNNWNQVCNGGLIAAAITVFEEEPELATKTLHRALEGLPYCLISYIPDGVYPEGSTYWGYGTGYSLVTISMLESCFGTDFGISAYPGFMESAMFRVMCNAPSEWMFNFADCGDRRDQNGDLLLAWFATRTGNPIYYERERLLQPIEDMDNLSNIAGMAMVWLSQYEEKSGSPQPSAWAGKGKNPIAVFKDQEGDDHGYYLGCKGGQAGISHGNMDAGSFVFELHGVRWSVDPGNQSYSGLAAAGINQWDRTDGSERWTVLIKNNFGHSTLTVNDALFKAKGFAPLVAFTPGDQPEATFELTGLYAGKVQRALRRFVQDSPTSVVIQDRITSSDSTQKVVWQLITTADVELVESGAVLRQDGEILDLQLQSTVTPIIRVVSLDPPPADYDKRIDGLKRVEIELQTRKEAGQHIQLDVRLAGRDTVQDSGE